MSAISIRKAGPADAPVMAELCTQLGYPTDAAVVAARFKRLCVDENARILVAESDGTVVGLTTVHVCSVINHDAPIAQLTLLVVDERHRTAGAGRALVDAVEAWARERGSRRLVVTTALDRAVAHIFYERRGFKHTGRRYAKDLSQ